MVLTSTTAGVRSWGAVGGIRFKKFTYDFAVHGGAVSTIALATDTTEQFPKYALIDASQSFIVTETALTSGSADPTITIGLFVSHTAGGYLATDPDMFLASQLFSAAPFNAVGDVTMGRALVGQLGSISKVTITIGTNALTAGKINIYVAYIEAA
jgi:hypothetical protein